MQVEIEGLGLPVEVRIHGINGTGHGGSNETACQGKDLPWLQEVPEEPVWTRWDVTYRDVIILDEDNKVLSIFNLTEHDLSKPADYAALKALLVGYAGGE